MWEINVKARFLCLNELFLVLYVGMESTGSCEFRYVGVMIFFRIAVGK